MILVRTCKKRNLSACARLSAVSPLALSSQQQQHPSNALVTHFMIHRSAADNYHHPPRHFTRNLNSSGKFSSSRDDRKSNDGSMQKLQSMGHSESVSKEVITALETLYGKGKVTVASLESFGDIGLQTLVSSVVEAQKSKRKKRSAMQGTAHFIIPHHRCQFDMPMESGQSILDLAKSSVGVEMLGEYIEGACGGTMSCATCHIILDRETFDKLNPPTSAEKDMLDLAYEPVATSRLGCQVKMSPETDGMTVTIPAGVNNFWS